MAYNPMFPQQQTWPGPPPQEAPNVYSQGQRMPGTQLPMPAMSPSYSYQQPQPMQNQQTVKTMEFVQGQAAAESFPQPPWLPPGIPIPLWDSTNNVIWFKSWTPIGMANPLAKATYKMEPPPQEMLPAGGNSGAQDMSGYVTKADLDQKFDSLMSMVQSMQQQQQMPMHPQSNQNGNQQVAQNNPQSNNSRGGGRNG